MVNASMGQNITIGWLAETSYAEDANTTLASDINRLGIVTDFSLNASVERANVYGLGSQVRINDPIMRKKYEWSATVLWQTSQDDDTIYQFVNDVIDNYAVANWNSYCFRIKAVPGGGSTYESLYLEGVVVSSISFKFAAGEVISVELSGFAAAVYNNNWIADASYSYPAGGIPSTVATDPTAWYTANIAIGSNLVDISAQWQDFTVDIKFNPAQIDSFDNSGEIALAAPGHLEVGWSGSYYGDDTSMGVDSMLSVMIGDSVDDSLAISVDGVSTLTLTYVSVDSVSLPIKEKELIIGEVSGMANGVTI